MKFISVRVLAFGVVGALAACAPSENGGTNNLAADAKLRTSSSDATTGQSTAQRALAQRQRDYAKVRAQSAALGAGAAGLLCALSKCTTEQTIAAMAAGGAAGYMAGGYMTNRDTNFNATQETLQNDIKLAREDNAKLAGSIQAANEVVAFQKSEITRLNSGLSSGAVTTAAYRTELKSLEKDVAATRSLRTTSEERLSGLDNSIRQHDAAGLATVDLRAQRDAQQQQIAQLRQAEQQMLETIGRAPASVQTASAKS